jgi:hypothetical protein
MAIGEAAQATERGDAPPEDVRWRLKSLQYATFEYAIFDHAPIPGGTIPSSPEKVPRAPWDVAPQRRRDRPDFWHVGGRRHEHGAEDRANIVPFLKSSRQ